MTNNTPDYNDNLYFEKKMDCKNCPYTDEYCASGDCKRNADVSKTLTEQCKKGELPLGKYYIKCKDDSVTTMYLGNDDYSVRSIKSKGFKIIAPVPTFDEWIASYNCMLENEVLRLKNAQLKDLLKQSRIYVKIETEDYDDRTVSKADKEEAKKLLKQIDEVLK